MKRLLVFIILVCGAMPAYSQPVEGMVRYSIGDMFRYQGIIGSLGLPRHDLSIVVRVRGDTVIEGKKYAVLHRRSNREPIWSLHEGDSILFRRVEGRAIYAYTNSLLYENKEWTLVDFDDSVGTYYPLNDRFVMTNTIDVPRFLTEKTPFIRCALSAPYNHVDYHAPIGETYINVWFGTLIKYEAQLAGMVLNGVAYGDTSSYIPLSTDSEADPEPSASILSQNYPNPVSSSDQTQSTTIEYILQRRTQVTLTVTSLLGNTVATLVDDVQDPGKHTVQFNPSRYRNISSGLYFYVLGTGGQRIVKRMVVR